MVNNMDNTCIMVNSEGAKMYKSVKIANEIHKLIVLRRTSKQGCQCISCRGVRSRVLRNKRSYVNKLSEQFIMKG